MPDTNLEQGFGFLLNDVSRLLRVEFERRVRGCGLTRPQWILLSYVARHPDRTLGELAELVQQEKITVSRQVSRMEKSGWLQFHDLGGDRRGSSLRLTRKAEGMMIHLASVAGQLRDDALGVLQAGRREALIKDLAEVKANLERMVQAAG